jgi:hypothetical protein
VNELERRRPELLMLLGSVGIRVSEIVTGLFEDSLSCEEQCAFERQLRGLAEGFRRRVMRTPLAEDPDIQYVIVHKLDRLARNHEDDVQSVSCWPSTVSDWYPPLKTLTKHPAANWSTAS